MDQGQLPLDGQLSQDNSSWILRWSERSGDAKSGEGSHSPSPVRIGSAMEPGGLTEKQAKDFARNDLLSFEQIDPAKQSQMTLANFVESRFVPEHVALKRYAGRAHYKAILKHVLNPEEVDRAFHIDQSNSKAKLKSCPDWPYLGSVRLGDARPCHVQGLISAALARGYSTQTAKHIRSVVSAIFSHAIEKHCFEGDNPASLVRLPAMIRKQAHILTPQQTQEVLSSMRYPEKEMTLFTVLTGMNVTEICGLQWECLNLTNSERQTEEGPIPPRTIAVRKHLYRGELTHVAKNRIRNLRIPKPLVSILTRLSHRSKYIAPDDFVLVSRNGSAINQTNIVVRRLRPIGKDLHMPWLTWQVFRRTHCALASESGSQFQELIEMMAYPDLQQESRPRQKWRDVPRLDGLNRGPDQECEARAYSASAGDE
jgi:integrase